MTRKLKFRAWDVKTKFFWGDGEGMAIKKLAFNFYSNLFDEPETLIFQQFTGLKDKNGKEIYEGDLVKDNSGYLFKVYWLDTVASFELVCVEECEVPVDYVEPTICFTSILEVVGNIFETPELLKKRG